MGRVKAACVVLLLLIAFAVFGHISTARTTDTLLQELWQTEQYVLQRDYPKAGESIDRLTEYCESKEPLLTLFLRRDLFNALRTNLSGLDSYLNAQYHNDLLMELARSRAQVLAIYQQYFSFV